MPRAVRRGRRRGRRGAGSSGGGGGCARRAARTIRGGCAGRAMDSGAIAARPGSGRRAGWDRGGGSGRRRRWRKGCARAPRAAGEGHCCHHDHSGAQRERPQYEPPLAKPPRGRRAVPRARWRGGVLRARWRAVPRARSRGGGPRARRRSGRRRGEDHQAAARLGASRGAQIGIPHSGNHRSSSCSTGNSAPIWALSTNSRSLSRCCGPAGTNG
jgi:hypothetical protein